MKIWAKLITNNDLIKDLIYESSLPISFDNYNLWVSEICNKFDIPTPVIVPYHYKNFVYYYNSVFKADDFIPSLDYDQLRIEDCKE